MTTIEPAVRRTTVQVRFADGLVLEGPLGTTVEKFIEVAKPDVKGRVVAALINGKLRELSQPLESDA
ncbi:MAG: hypothetical protein JSV68_10560, partial [Anaerolineaceae bacterium]